jgi:hypothetical protein
LLETCTTLLVSGQELSLHTCSTPQLGIGGEFTSSPSLIEVSLTQALSAKTAFFWAGCTALCLIWAFFRIPETKGFTFAELDHLFEEGVPARKFASSRKEIIKASEGSEFRG